MFKPFLSVIWEIWQRCSINCLILLIGVVTSESQLLPSLSLVVGDLLSCSVIIAASLSSAYIIGNYMLRCRRSRLFDLMEYMGLPMCAALASTPLSRLLLTAPSLLMVVKILWYNQNYLYGHKHSTNFNTISPEWRLLRVIKINVLPYAIALSSGVYLGVTCGMALLSVGIFFFKFTFQRCVHQYILSLGVIIAAVSGAQLGLSQYFGWGFYQVGLSLGVTSYLLNWLTFIIQGKYTSERCTASKHQEDNLALFCAFEDVIFKGDDEQDKFRWSEHAHGQMVAIFEGMIKNIHENNLQITMSNFFTLIQMRLKSSQNFFCFEYYTYKCLFLQRKRNEALIGYYSRLKKLNALQRPQFTILYNTICGYMDKQPAHRQQIEFINFQKLIGALIAKLLECCSEELTLVEYLCEIEERKEWFPIGWLLRRANIKNEIIRLIEECLKMQSYSTSSQFKCIYLLFSVHICKSRVKEEVRRMFFREEAVKASGDDCLIVMSGANYGQILHANEFFRNRFKVSLKRGSKNNISEFIPSERQKNLHEKYFNQTEHLPTYQSHGALHCYVVLEAELLGKSLHRFEKMQIVTRIYYEESSSFNYVCVLTSLDHVLRLSHLDYEAVKDGLEVLNEGGIHQLGENMLWKEVRLDMEEESEDDYSDAPYATLLKTKTAVALLDEEKQSNPLDKLTIIEEKLREEQGARDMKHIIGGKIILFLIIISLSLYFYFSHKAILNTFTDFIQTEKRVLRDIQMAEQRHLSLLVLWTALGNRAITDGACAEVGISSLIDFVGEQMTVLLENASVNHNYELEISNNRLFSKLITLSSKPGLTDSIFLANYTSSFVKHSPLLSYSKYIDLLKSFLFQLNGNPLAYVPVTPNVSLEDIIATKLISLSLLTPGTMYSTLSDRQSQYVSAKGAWLSAELVILLVVLGLLGIGIIILHIHQYRQVVAYLSSLESMDIEKVRERGRRVKMMVDDIRQLQINKINQVDIDGNLIVSFKTKGDSKRMDLKRYAEYYRSGETTEDPYLPSIKHLGEMPNKKESEPAKVAMKRRVAPPNLPTPKWMRVVLFAQWEVGFLLGLLFLLGACQVSLVAQHITELHQISHASQAETALSTIVEKVGNVVAYQWLKLEESTKANTIRPSESALLNSTLIYLLSASYQSSLYVYGDTFANTALFGDICGFVLNSSFCRQFRSGLFLGGLSAVIPAVIQDEFEFENATPRPTSPYLSNLCSKTALLYLLLVPCVNGIEVSGMNSILAAQWRNEVGWLIGSALISAVLVGFMVMNWQQTQEIQSKVRREVLMMDSVQELYINDGFKHYLNRIYYD